MVRMMVGRDDRKKAKDRTPQSLLNSSSLLRQHTHYLSTWWALYTCPSKGTLVFLQMDKMDAYKRKLIRGSLTSYLILSYLILSCLILSYLYISKSGSVPSNIYALLLSLILSLNSLAFFINLLYIFEGGDFVDRY